MPETLVALVADAGEIARIAEAIAASPLVAFDLEFLSADRLHPRLCLVQVSWVTEDVAAPTVALLDPLAVDTRPVIAALAAHRRCVAHAARQDLWILAHDFGIEFPAFIDSQVMAAFAGIGDQVGYGALVGEVLGVALDKGSQWTDWARRPLKDTQVAYAIADVRYLPRIYEILADRLGPRLAWAEAESSEVAAAAVEASNVTEDTAWRDIGIRGLDADAVGAVVALAAWRWRVATELDRPLGQVLNEKTLLEIARMKRPDEGAIRSIKGIAPIARNRAEDIVAALATATPAEERVRASYRPPSVRAQRWSELLLAIAQIVAEREGVAARLLATRSDAEAIARLADEAGLEALRDHPWFATWRGPVLGAIWRGFLSGTVGLVGDPTAPHGLQLRDL